eukprot:TRINITY_DN7797_c0_g1_i1.p1 TRINITY_DN7797_c0_g1~~TRINITY_DN7797_c0_g1_i1.p1  ORF type:complete len:85 (-),score=11.50 TRINITY_DN7797_c0_g1_i1:67-321(-)
MINALLNKSAPMKIIVNKLGYSQEFIQEYKGHKDWCVPKIVEDFPREQIDNYQSIDRKYRVGLEDYKKTKMPANQGAMKLFYCE